MEILINSDLMNEILVLLRIDDLRNLFLACHFLDKRWIKNFYSIYDNTITLLEYRLHDTVEELNYFYVSTHRRNVEKMNYEPLLVRSILLTRRIPKYLSPNYFDHSINYVLQRIIENDFSDSENRLYAKIINSDSFCFDSDNY